MWFDSWSSVARVLLTCVVGYVVIVAIVRTSGKRALTKMNAFDFVVNVALGSMLATMVLSSRVPVVNGLIALVAISALQYAVSWGSLRSAPLRQLVKANPALLCYRGELQHDVLRRERISVEEVRSAVRQQGMLALDQAEAVVLETSGDLAVVARADARPTALVDVEDGDGHAARRAAGRDARPDR